MYESAFRSIDDMLWANLGVSISLLLGLLAVFRADLTQSLVSIRAVGREGLSEIKATYGGFFIGISLYALTAQSSTVFTVIGTGWLSAALVRFLSILSQGYSLKNLGGVIFEAVVGLLCLS